jgi:hypothetical protein
MTTAESEASANAEEGQTLVEFILVLPILAVAIAGTFWLLRAATLRTECTRTVFEAVRGSLGENAVAAFNPYRNGVFLRRDDEGVEGWKKCGTHVERLFLPHLGRRKAGA